MSSVRIVFDLIRGIIADCAELAAENLALRQQLAVLFERKKRLRLRKRDRIFWAWLSRFWPDWRSVLVIVQAQDALVARPLLSALAPPAPRPVRLFVGVALDFQFFTGLAVV